MQSDLDVKKAKRNIEMVQEKMQNNTDILLLKEYHRLYKKEISLFKRSWAAAWLFMYYDKKENPPLRSGGVRGITEKRSNSKKTQTEKLSESVLPEEKAKKLFISIGKNRRLFPREVISLIMSKTTAEREDIGVIRILDNYSFVQVRDSKADEIIGALNGINFRGKSLAVNYARPKNDSTGE
jgi:hypothetical protein